VCADGLAAEQQQAVEVVARGGGWGEGEGH